MHKPSPRRLSRPTRRDRIYPAHVYPAPTLTTIYRHDILVCSGRSNTTVRRPHLRHRERHHPRPPTRLGFALTLYNTFAPLLPESRVVPEGRPGEGGLWPRFIPPKDTDSRSCCPMLNTMAKHGLPRDGRNITFRELSIRVRETSASRSDSSRCRRAEPQLLDGQDRSQCAQLRRTRHVPMQYVPFTHSSIRRQLTHGFHNPDQPKPAPHLRIKLLESGTGPGGDITASDLSRMLGKWRAQSKARNGQYSQAMVHKLFGASNGATLLTICGGWVKDL
ncbi:uncharacterized protein B0H18DRAFT_1140192 [Fomitopsis serialis]|uniref:uncharacterized protein n=1 Tax=Fomitopsis serialis TaxID=139415 RepID=UPI0020088F63|nr:uncharacterized protein B0H18DRAFT_1140192 [Neoantrodia serialis]KAH9931411.1 hypothetical protein B0H18DRAFT_1140192 [Neoantrodia serialis]